MALTTEQVAWEQGVTVAELLDSTGLCPEQVSTWQVEDVPLAALHGRYEPGPYLAEEGEYLVCLAHAVGAGEVPLPAFVKRDGRYHHADGAHRVVVALLRGAETIRAYVAEEV